MPPGQRQGSEPDPRVPAHHRPRRRVPLGFAPLRPFALQKADPGHTARCRRQRTDRNPSSVCNTPSTSLRLVTLPETSSGRHSACPFQFLPSLSRGGGARVARDGGGESPPTHNKRSTAWIATPTSPPTTVPLIRMNCRSRPTAPSIRSETVLASHRFTVSETSRTISEP